MGNKFIDNLAADIRIAFLESKGYSVRNLKYMAKLAETYSDREFVQQVVAQIPWGHNNKYSYDSVGLPSIDYDDDPNKIMKRKMDSGNLMPFRLQTGEDRKHWICGAEHGQTW